MEPEFVSILGRLESLERDYRNVLTDCRRLQHSLTRARWFCCLSLVGLLAVIVSVAAAPLKSLETDKLSINDQGGKPRIVLEVGDDGIPTLSFLDQAGKSRFGIRSDPGGSTGLSILDAVGKPRCLLNLEGDGTAKLSLLNGRGHAQFDSVVSREGLQELKMTGSEASMQSLQISSPVGASPALRFTGDQGERSVVFNGCGPNPDLVFYGPGESPRLMLGISSSNATPRLAIMSKNEKPVVSLAVPDDVPQLSLQNPSGKSEFLLGISKSMPMALMRDQASRVRLVIIAPDSGTTELRLFDKDGNPTFQAPPVKKK